MTPAVFIPSYSNFIYVMIAHTLKYHTLFFRKLGKMSQNLSAAAVVISALRVKN